ncbi:N-acetylmuramoyl-L-alanine amidase [bacterium D16-51]|nr:N-acetylmuramoyl-L-alanine amidase [bacterium D16-59]RKI60292.1 N-acetylmuramoyl-L-alanine amidase [bacterium D16-51]
MFENDLGIVEIVILGNRNFRKVQSEKMELKEWRRLAVQSVSLLLAVFVCCVCFGEQIQESTEHVVHAEAAPQVGTDIGGADKNQEVLPEIDINEAGQDAAEEKIVVIDAGHGGMDEGTSSRNQKHYEKEYTLLIAKRLQKLMGERGIRAYYTRMDDSLVTKKERVKQAKKLEADLLISIHCNASSIGDTTANGMETLYSARKTDNASMTNKKLAQIMLDEMVKETGLRKRGVIKRDGLYVLNHADMPAVILEVGYMSNNKDLNYLRKAGGQQKIAQGICNGIVKALEEL